MSDFHIQNIYSKNIQKMFDGCTVGTCPRLSINA